uniref:photosystem I assembly protein ycf4 n=1 Tax=Phaeocystis rex TaxID=1631189 RepID=UPI0024112201|nr:photosystem I assembly protein ycf4 [Phaeocystis rex]WEL35980.1 photosystem I assembly protein ycf4 [Phaeocystis rex]
MASESTIRSYLVGSRRLSNVSWAIIVSLGGIGFFLTGLSSYFNVNLLIFSDSSNITFLPQGIVLLFYGTVGSILGIFLWLTIWWDIGFGYNEYNQTSNEVVLYRQGFPGKNRELKLKFIFSEIKSIKMKIEEGLNPKRQLFMCLKDSREIPLTGVDRPTSLSQIEQEAVKLAQYLNVYLETN